MQHQQYQQPNRQRRPPFTKEDLRVLQKCKTDSFYYRSLPISVILGNAAYFLMKNGTISKSLSYGYVPKVVFAICSGMVIGRLSYTKKCVEMIKQNDTEFSRFIQRQQSSQSLFNQQSPISTEDAIRDDLPSSQLESEGLFEYNQLADNLSEYSEAAEPTKQPPSYTSYSDLRDANRNEQNMRYRNSYRPPVPNAPYGDNEEPMKSPSSRLPATQGYDAKKNKYGDVWDQ